MNVIVTGRHFDVSDALRGYAEEKVKKFQKYLANIKEATPGGGATWIRRGTPQSWIASIFWGSPHRQSTFCPPGTTCA